MDKLKYITNHSNIKGRGAQGEIKNRFSKLEYAKDSLYSDIDLHHEELGVKTTYQEIFPKSIVNKVNSPDIKKMQLIYCENILIPSHGNLLQ